ncbi:hypothetical protein C2E23DRAFT_733802 [Lenzites betulinus]|nr:hypothetical protein C2E23DRAFT_733802 [Lenzites betulinus]
MFSNSLIATVALCLGLANAHAIITPALGVTGAAVRADVQRPSASSECGTVNIAQSLDSSPFTIADPATGIFNANITDFNGGVDGSRQIDTALVSDNAQGNFTEAPKATVLTNGDLSPTVVGSQPLVVQLPAGTVCSGGATADKCLVSFTTAGGFGNCVVVQLASS